MKQFQKTWSEMTVNGAGPKGEAMDHFSEDVVFMTQSPSSNMVLDAVF